MGQIKIGDKTISRPYYSDLGKRVVQVKHGDKTVSLERAYVGIAGHGVQAFSTSLSEGSPVIDSNTVGDTAECLCVVDTTLFIGSTTKGVFGYNMISGESAEYYSNSTIGTPTCLQYSSSGILVGSSKGLWCFDTEPNGTQIVDTTYGAIECLYTAPNGNIFAGTQSGAILQITGTTYTVAANAANMKNVPVTDIVVLNGSLYGLTTTQGLIHSNGDVLIPSSKFSGLAKCVVLFRDKLYIQTESELGVWDPTLSTYTKLSVLGFYKSHGLATSIDTLYVLSLNTLHYSKDGSTWDTLTTFTEHAQSITVG